MLVDTPPKSNFIIFFVNMNYLDFPWSSIEFYQVCANSNMMTYYLQKLPFGVFLCDETFTIPNLKIVLQLDILETPKL